MDVSKVQELAKKAGVKSVDDAIAFALGFKDGVRVKEEDKKPRTDGKTCVLYVIFYWISHSHLFNKLEIHITFMYTYVYPLYLLTHSLIHKLTQRITHTYVTLEPQGDGRYGFGGNGNSRGREGGKAER